MKKKLLAYSICFVILFMSISAYPWVGETHRQITEQVEVKTQETGILHDYLKQLGFERGRYTNFTLKSSGYYLPAHFKSRAILFSNFGYTNSALDWLTIGSVEEDTPITRARHHFHDRVPHPFHIVEWVGSPEDYRFLLRQ